MSDYIVTNEELTNYCVAHGSESRYALTPQNDSELYHHGVLGMKWGVRRYQSYAENPKLSDRKKNESFKGSSETDDIKTQLIINASIIGISVAAAVIRGKLERKRCKKEIEERKNNREVQNLEDLPKINKKTTPAQDMKQVNPNWPADGYTNNCAICTAAIAMRQKGYDVEAGTSEHGYIGEDFFGATFNAKEQRIRGKNAQDAIKKIVESQEEGAYGSIGVYWKYGMGGHSMFYRIENGTLNIYDGQVGEKHNNDDIFRSIDLKDIRISRLDNVEPTEYALGFVNPKK